MKRWLCSKRLFLNHPLIVWAGVPVTNPQRSPAKKTMGVGLRMFAEKG
jgi:hypothetical protein